MREKYSPLKVTRKRTGLRVGVRQWWAFRPLAIPRKHIASVIMPAVIAAPCVHAVCAYVWCVDALARWRSPAYPPLWRSNVFPYD